MKMMDCGALGSEYSAEAQDLFSPEVAISSSPGSAAAPLSLRYASLEPDIVPILSIHETILAAQFKRHTQMVTYWCYIVSK